MNHQLALAIQLNQQATLEDFCWAENPLLQQQLNNTLNAQGERFIFLWGKTGCGKSHLLQACCQAMTQSGRTSAYLPLTLLQEWGPESIEGMENHALIAIDDIELISHDKVWEEALFHLYNRVRDNEKTLLLISSKQTPAALDLQLPDLRSRLGSGLVLPIYELSDELKISVLQQQANKRGFQLTEQVAFFLLNRCDRNMHALQQVLEQLDKASLIEQRKITIPFVKAILKV
ncbi:MAG: DnaA regulatory inactivator Hda [Silvanigrellaceae bacterium]|nr:DnaA regulatory inactivator Hda [Silvanigrellaceae bacterium]